MDSLSSDYIRRIYGNAKGQGLDNDALHSLVFQITGKESIKKLTHKEAEAVIKKLGGRIGRQTRRSNGGKGTITEKQKKMLFALMYRLSEIDKREGDVGSRLLGLAKRMHGRDRIEWLTVNEAAELIEAIKKMVERSEKNGYIKNSKSDYITT